MRNLVVKTSLSGAALLLGVGVLAACGDDKKASGTGDGGTTGATSDATTSGETTTSGSISTAAWCEALGSSGDDLKAAIALGVPDDMPEEAKDGLKFLAENQDKWDNPNDIDPSLAMDHFGEIMAVSSYMLSACLPDMESLLSDLPTDYESMLENMPTDYESMLENMPTDYESMMSDLENLLSDLPTQ